MRAFKFILLFLFHVLLTRAQVFPVTADLKINATRVERISALGGFGAVIQPVQLSLLLNDLSIPSRSVTLRFSLTGEGLSMTSGTMDAGAALVLESGVPYVVPETVIASYFQFDNLSGISYDTYTGMLPEGYYQFCVEVFDMLSGKRLSARVCEVFYHNRREPPLLLSPERGATVPVVTPQAVFFQWTPRGYSPGMVRYQLRLVEVWDTSQDPQAAFLSSSPIFETTTTAPSFLYDLQATPLIPDKRYAWRVSEWPLDDDLTRSGTPLTESEVFWFDYTSPCELPTGIAHEVKGRSQANISWEDNSNVLSEYTVRYRKAGDDHQWFYSSTSFNWLTLWGLEGETRYEYQVLRKCELSETVFSNSHFFTTGITNLPEDVLECGIAPAADIHSEVALPVLEVGEHFTAGDFTIEVHEVQGAQGRFSGQGVVRIPYLANIRVGVRFTNVFINNDRALASGVVHTVYDKQWTNMLDIDAVIDEVEDVVDAITGDDIHTVSFPDMEIGEGQIEVSDGKVIITAPDGSITTIDQDQGDVLLITDATGGQWQVSGDGEVTRVGEGAPGGAATPVNTTGVAYDEHGAPAVKTLGEDGGAIQFYRGEDTRYALDLADSDWKKQRYPVLQDKSGAAYHPLHKAVLSGATDHLYVRLEEVGMADSLVIKTMEGREIPATVIDGGKGLRMELSGLEGYRQEQVVLCAPDGEGKYTVVATFYLHHLPPMPEVKVILVPGANGAIPESITTLAREVFDPVGVSLELEEAAVFAPDKKLWDTGNVNGMMDYHGSGLLADYPGEFKDFQKAFMASEHFTDPEACYLFFPGAYAGNTGGIAGFMPPGRQWGYVFEGGSIEAKGSTAEVALHELGHGLLGLEHPEDTGSEGALMDRGAGTSLTYLDWQQLSSDKLQLHWFDDDSDKEIGGRTWFTPEWKPFKVADTRVISSKQIGNIPDGTVPGFKADGQYYHAVMGESGFLGYQNAAGEVYKITEVTDLDSDDKVYLFKQDGGCGYNSYYSATYGDVQQDLPELSLYDESVYTFEATIPCDGPVAQGDLFLTRICEQGGDYELPEEDMLMLAGVLKAAHVRRVSLGTMTHAPVGEFHHLLNFGDEQLGESQQVLEDKLFLLKALTGINFYVLGYDSSGRGALNEPEKRAQAILDQIPGLQQEPTVLIFAGYNALHTNSGMVSCMVSGMALSDATLIGGDHFTPGTYQDLYSLASGAFAALEKPYVLHRFYLRANGEVLYTHERPESGKGVRGLPFIYATEFYKSPHLEQIAQMQQDLRDLQSMNSEMMGQLDQSLHYRELRDDWMADMNNLLSQAMIEEEMAFGSDPGQYWKADESKLGVLREALLDHPDKLKAYYATTTASNEYAARWGIQFGSDTALDKEDYYDYNAFALIDEMVYAGLDLAAFVPNPYVEGGAEVAGIVYASFRGDLEMAGMYSTALVIPFSGVRQVVDKLDTASEASRLFAAFASKVDDRIEINVKSLRESKAWELQLTPVITNREVAAPLLEKEIRIHYKDLEWIKTFLKLPRRGKQNLLKINWKSFPDCYQCDRTAMEFWADESKAVMHYMQNKYYIKHDLETGELLLGNKESGDVLAYMRGKDNEKFFAESGYDEALEILRRYKGEGGDPIIIDLNASNLKKVTSTPGKCTTIIGKFIFAEEGITDMQDIIKKLLGNLKHQMFDGPCNNGFNILNVSDLLAGGDFWEKFNKPWLLKAIERGDVIYAATDPMDIRMVIRDKNVLAEYDFENFQELIQFLKSSPIANNKGVLSGYGQEIQLLFQNGYTYDPLTKIFIK
ncbi:fibronectin type III domain-containing protein [Robertkochia sediminum]|uniref:fibronectin type III domain-containing protein n=1 Tax=Robertkochia sediminum TaxID=2785326 RepID=UPI0019332175|nr:fibronectin type III domain-containing protein [Robertkochia sediminum]MBL7472251.1 fibronectin type III domain-containing protein [Robertkochia sediminum]